METHQTAVNSITQTRVRLFTIAVTASSASTSETPVLDDAQTVTESKGQLTDRVRARLGDVVTGDRHAVKIA
jgi:hypothetical protein